MLSCGPGTVLTRAAPRVKPLAASSSKDIDALQQRGLGLVGEDSAVFSFEDQTFQSWGAFLAVLSTVLTALYFLWINPETGYGEGNYGFEAASLPSKR